MMDSEQLRDAERLVELYAKRVDAASALAALERPTFVDVDAVLAVGRELDEACEAFRRRWAPRAGRVLVGLYCVMSISPAGRRVTRILDRFDDYTLDETA
ncbi:hypothetical protein GCM10022215_29440 [Nocardioides fonticola]|uniref:Uncharacterized protein n=1 Tax=Nocardioides fonticola TaxID=450363 RepID=A0ABP7XRG9_9ACTN